MDKVEYDLDTSGGIMEVGIFYWDIILSCQGSFYFINTP